LLRLTCKAVKQKLKARHERDTHTEKVCTFPGTRCTVRVGCIWWAPSPSVVSTSWVLDFNDFCTEIESETFRIGKYFYPRSPNICVQYGWEMVSDLETESTQSEKQTTIVGLGPSNKVPKLGICKPWRLTAARQHSMHSLGQLFNQHESEISLPQPIPSSYPTLSTPPAVIYHLFHLYAS
jgi:hypothetical protein